MTSDWPDLFFWMMIAFLFTHEMDAMKRHEWRVLPLTSFLPESIGREVFLWMHVPLFFVLFLLSTGSHSDIARWWLSIFSIVHVALHWLFRNHPKYEFNNVGSWLLIAGAGIAGLAHIVSRGDAV
jgi:hypothetical protein